MTTLSQLEVANLKDNVLRYLRKNSDQTILFELITNSIIPDTVTVTVFKEYLREMEQDKVIKATEASGRLLLILTGKGKKFLIEGGYYSKYEKGVSKKEQEEALKKEQEEALIKEQQEALRKEQQEALKKEQQEAGHQRNIEKTNLETENLKLTKWLSIIAIIISVVSILISILKK